MKKALFIIPLLLGVSLVWGVYRPHEAEAAAATSTVQVGNSNVASSQSVTDLNAKLSAVSSSVQQIQADYSGLKGLLGDMPQVQTAVNANTSQINNIQTSLGQLNNTVSSLQSDVNSLKSGKVDVADFNQLQTTTSNSFNSLSQQIAVLQFAQSQLNISSLQEAASTNAQQIASLGTQLGGTNNTLTALSTDFNGLKSDVASLSSKLSSLSSFNPPVVYDANHRAVGLLSSTYDGSFAIKLYVPADKALYIVDTNTGKPLSPPSSFNPSNEELQNIYFSELNCTGQAYTGYRGSGTVFPAAGGRFFKAVSILNNFPHAQSILDINNQCVNADPGLMGGMQLVEIHPSLSFPLAAPLSIE